MFINQNFKADYMHILFAGTNVFEERYTFADGDKQIGEMHIYLDGESMYIDHFEIKSEHRGKGWGTKMVSAIFPHFKDVKTIWAMAEEQVLDEFWSKQKGFTFRGEGHDEQEGYFWFEINHPDSKIEMVLTQ
jgi:GNAT superfamily N-acetyltransferase